MKRRMDRREFAASGLALVAAALSTQAGPTLPPPLDVAAPRRSPWTPRDLLLAEIPSLMELATVPGLAFAVVEGARVSTYVFGTARRELLQAVSESTKFEAASLGKPLFAAAVLRLVDAGALQLDRPLSSYVALPDVTDAGARAITTRHVLSHTTGLPNWRQAPGPLLPASPPGSRFSYSGEGFFYLQRVIERLVGRPIEQVMREQVFDPLGMASSSYVWQPASADRMATGYDERGTALEVYADIGRKLQPLAEQWHKPMSEWLYADEERATREAFPSLQPLAQFMMPNVAGSLFTTIADYSRFLAAILAEGGGALAFSPAMRQAMVTSQVALNSRLSWGLGWGLEHDGSAELLWQWGANGSFRNFVLADPPRRRGVVVLTNSANGPKVYERIISSLTGSDHPAFLWFQV
jgi:CubicO group peptidase (beta-lactamase class C family)